MTAKINARGACLKLSVNLIRNCRENEGLRMLLTGDVIRAYNYQHFIEILLLLIPIDLALLPVVTSR